MEDQYGLADLRHYASGGGRTFFPAAYPPPLFPPNNRSSAADGHPYYALNFASDHPIAPPAMAAGGQFATESGGGDGGAGRWPRQETLTLLEIRSKLDPKFKEANQKGPLWDEVSRIMSEEYGYSRNGKKCREKFENLYKYYKKTKGGKAGRQDGKHYRFFRQLEALYGDQTNNNNSSAASASDQQANNFECFRPNYNHHHQLQDHHLVSISNSSDFDTLVSSSSSDNDDPKRGRKGKGGLRAKIKDTIDTQMRRMMEKQEAWMEKMTRTIEENEHERLLREEQWRRQDAERIEREQKVWAGEKAWIEARDAALMDAFRKMVTGKETSLVPDDDDDHHHHHRHLHESWDCVTMSDFNSIKKRKESSDQSSEQGFDDNNATTNDISCFRYFNGGDNGYGRIIN